MRPLTWVLESDVFPASHRPLRDAIRAAGETIVDWNDEWLTNGNRPALTDTPAVFHGSLGNAAVIAARFRWCPGAWCNTTRFCCSAWYDSARAWLVHKNWRIIPADEFVKDPDSVFAAIGASDQAFVRPDSPLKPFSGRVVRRERVSLAALDHGFYYEDRSIPVVVAQVCEIGREWRFIVVQRTVVAGSAYNPLTRSALTETASTDAWVFAMHVARQLAPPDDVYVMDICEAAGELRLLELNPFSGADLYASSSVDVVTAVTAVACDIWETRHLT